MREDELQYALERVISAGQGFRTKLPLRVGFDIAAPVVNSLRVARTTPVGTTGTEVTLTWIDPEDYREFISTLRVYQSDRESTTPVVVAEPTRSPCKIFVPATGARVVTFRIQTALRNGQVSDLDVSPATSVAVQ